MVLGIHVQELAVRGHHFRGQQIVNRQPVLADQVANAAAQRDAANAHRAGIAEAGSEAVRACRGGIFAGS